jgi:anaerobic selenocysteine-containing dehydrogenase
VAPYRWEGVAEAPAAVPVDAYALRLVAGHTLYGSEAVVVATPALAALVSDTTLGVNPRDRDRLGVADGDVVRVTSLGGSIDLPVRDDPDTEQGSAFIAVNRAGPGAADLIDVTAPVTELRVETIT